MLGSKITYCHLINKYGEMRKNLDIAGLFSVTTLGTYICRLLLTRCLSAVHSSVHQLLQFWDLSDFWVVCAKQCWNHLEKCVEYGPPGLLGPKIKGSVVPKLSGTWTDFDDSKAIWKPFGPRCALCWPFSCKGPRGPHKDQGAQIWTGIRYMSANTGLIFALIIYKSHQMVTFNNTVRFTPAADTISL